MNQHRPYENLGYQPPVRRVPTAPPIGDLPDLLTPSEVAGLFRVDPKTITRRAKAGKLHSIRTLGGHRRYSKAEVLRLRSGQ